MTTDTTPVPCKCCWGEGVQKNLRTGITKICPCCGGTGVWIATPRIDWYEMATPTTWSTNAAPIYDDDEWDDEM